MFNIWNNWLLDNNLFYYYNFIQRAGRYNTARFIFNNSRIKILVLRKRLFTNFTIFIFFYFFVYLNLHHAAIMFYAKVFSTQYYIILLRKELK